MTDPMQIFDPAALARNRSGAARRVRSGDTGAEFLFDEMADRLLDRLDDVARPFAVALDLDSRQGLVAAGLQNRGKADTVIAADRNADFAERCRRAGLPAVQAGHDFLPFAPGSFDLVTSCLALHWVNDLPGMLVRINRMLKPDGLFQAALFGGETLTELRTCLMDAELEVTGGVSPRVSPMVDLRDAAGLLQRAGFALPVADVDRITVTYSSPFALMAELRAMGEGNAIGERLRHPTRRAVFLRAAQLYADRHAGSDGRIPATFDIVFLHGWHPAESQPAPLRPGSAVNRLADALDGTEAPAGDSVPKKPN